MFQDGGPPLFGAFALAAAIEIIEAEGMGTIHASVMANAKAIEETVRTVGGEILDPWDSDEERSGILSFRMPGEPAEATFQRLADAEVVASLRSEWVRVAPHASTDLAVTEVMAEVLDSRR
jgi:selenocysteine lyase/cysteine desulfurase